jgi:hypothetical protein
MEETESMKKATLLLALVLVVAMAVPAAAEVEEITVGGSIQARYQLLDPGFAYGHFAFDDDLHSMYWGTQRTLINVDAKLTGGVRAFAELQSFDFWGLSELEEEDGIVGPPEVYAQGDFLDVSILPLTYPFQDFGSYAGQGNPGVDLYQAYIEMDNIADTPLMARVGRQELVYGREWLVGNNNAGMNFSGLSFDGVKAGYESDALSIDAWWTQLLDLATPLQGISQDDSIDFFGVYGTYSGIENMALDAYFLWVRNDLTPDVNNLFTVGARLAGCWDSPLGLLDYNVEGAYQFGDTGFDGDYNAWAIDALAGYTFDQITWAPRLEVEYARFSGDDDLNDNDIETFTRLFSDVHYGELNLGGNLDSLMTNMNVFRGGVSAAPMEQCALSADVYYFLLADDDGSVLGAPPTSGQDDSVGWELDLAADYQYTEDLNLRAGWAIFWPGDALDDSVFFGDDTENYVYVQAMLVF